MRLQIVEYKKNLIRIETIITGNRMELRKKLSQKFQGLPQEELKQIIESIEYKEPAFYKFTYFRQPVKARLNSFIEV